jgi:hypothetical protein
LEALLASEPTAFTVVVPALVLILTWYVVDELVEGESKNSPAKITPAYWVAWYEPRNALGLLPTAVPPPIGVPPLVRSIWTPIFVVERVAGAETITRILLEVDLGVMLALKPVISVKLVLVVENVSVLVVDTTCKIPPDRDTAPIH